MTRLIITIVLLVGIITAAVFELMYINRVYNTLETELTAFSQIIYAQENIDTESNITKASDMYDYWIKHEHKLAMIARHIDLASISDALIYIKNFVAFNNKEETCVGIEKLRYLLLTRDFNVGISIQNII